MPTTSEHPIFEDYDTTLLARKTLVSEWYVLEMKNGIKPVSKHWRRKASLGLERPESELFVEES